MKKGTKKIDRLQSIIKLQHNEIVILTKEVANLNECVNDADKELLEQKEENLRLLKAIKDLKQLSNEIFDSALPDNKRNIELTPSSNTIKTA